MHICKKSSVHCNAVLALPCTSEEPHVFQNLEVVKKLKTHLRKKRQMYVHYTSPENAAIARMWDF